MPQELPGFYYDEEKKRYFPIKGPIPGSSRKPKPPPPPQRSKLGPRNRIRSSKLLQERELNGNLVSCSKGKFNFAEEFHKFQASQPAVWKFMDTENCGDSALAQVRKDVQTPEGLNERDALLAGGTNGEWRLFEVAKVGEDFNGGLKCIPERVCNSRYHAECGEIRDPRRFPGLASTISCIKSLGYRSRHALFTTLGSGASGGSVHVINYERITTMEEIASLDCTIWTGDCSPDARQAAVGTNLGVALVNLETGVTSWVCRSKSDVFVQQFDVSGNIVLCGLRNGAILTVDVREKHERVSDRLTRHSLPCSHLITLGPTRKWFKVKGHIYPSHTIFMPSSVCSLVSLQSYDKYFFASSMDGSVKLYDHRMTKAGAVQCYEGHVNTHTRLQLGVDWSERFVVAGGEDCKLRLWSIKSGELLFEQQPSTSTPLTACCSRPTGITTMPDYLSTQDRGLWFGSREGLFYVSCS